MRVTGGRKGRIVWVIQIVWDVIVAKGKRRSFRGFRERKGKTGNVKGTGRDEVREEALCPYEFLFFLQAGRAGRYCNPFDLFL